MRSSTFSMRATRETLRGVEKAPSAEHGRRRGDLIPSLRSIASLDIAPDLAAWKNVQRIATRVNPTVAQVDINDAIHTSIVRALEDNGYLAEARKKVALQPGRWPGFRAVSAATSMDGLLRVQIFRQ